MVENEYAQAIYDLAKEENKIDIISECFVVVNKSIENNDFMELFSSPKLTKEEKKNILTKVYGKLDSLFLDFMYVLIDNNRFNRISYIYDYYNQLIKIEHNILHIEAYSVKELTKTQIDNLRKTLSSYYNGKTLEIENIVDPKLIGGVRIECNGKTLDVTLKKSLANMKDSL